MALSEGTMPPFSVTVLLIYRRGMRLTPRGEGDTGRSVGSSISEVRVGPASQRNCTSVPAWRALRSHCEAETLTYQLCPEPSLLPLRTGLRKPSLAGGSKSLALTAGSGG